MPYALHILLTTVIAAIAPVACDSPPAADGAAAEADPVIEWLDKLEARGKDLESLNADVVYRKSNELTGDEIRAGEVHYRAPDEPKHPSARFRIDFTRLIIDGAARDVRREFVFDGSWLVEKDHERRFFQKRQIVAPGQVFDPLDIDGPFPVPIGQKRDAVLKRFDVELIPSDADGEHEIQSRLKLNEPPVHLRLKPRPDADNVEGQKKFETIDLWIDRTKLVPVRVVTKQKAVTTTVSLRKVELDSAEDAGDADKVFDTTPPKSGSGWRVEISPWRK